MRGRLGFAEEPRGSILDLGISRPLRWNLPNSKIHAAIYRTMSVSADGIDLAITASREGPSALLDLNAKRAPERKTSHASFNALVRDSTTEGGAVMPGLVLIFHRQS
jgi:hypothetical protein